MTLPNLPVDILGLIVELFRNDFTTLKRISLVCGPFRPLAQRHLFYQFGIAGDSRLLTTPEVASSRCLELKEFLRSRPSFLSHVHDLRVYASFRKQEDWVLQNANVLADILNQFSNSPLEKFYLHSYPSTVPWTQLSESLRNILLHIFGKIEALDILGFRDFPIDLFTRCKHLRGLDIDEMNFVDNTTAIPISSKPVIRNLKLFGKPPGIIEIITESGILDLSQLETLDIGMWDGVLDIKPLLLSDQIRELHLRWFTVGNANVDFGLHQKNDISLLSQLAMLRLITCWIGGASSFEISWVANTLESIRSHHLTSVELTFFAYFEPSGDDFKAFHALSALLARLCKESKLLRKITLNIWMLGYVEALPPIEEGLRKEIHSDWERNDSLFWLKVIRAPGSNSIPSQRRSL